MRELSNYCVFFYNILLDPAISWEVKEHPFGTMMYIFQENDIIPDSDPVLGRVDDVVMVALCLRELVGRLPSGSLCKYEQVLYANGIALRNIAAQGPNVLGTFYAHFEGIYRDNQVRQRPYLGSAIETGWLIKALNYFLATYKCPEWNGQSFQKVEKFLEAYGKKK
jgi:uncharacterized membrane protein YkvA (DUF1232 family)